jgi:hypothetical protein
MCVAVAMAMADASVDGPRRAVALPAAKALPAPAKTLPPAKSPTTPKSPAPTRPKSTKPTKSTSKGKGKSKPPKGHKHSARPSNGAHRADNMPPNWTWPPSRGMQESGDKCLAKLDEIGVVYQRAGAQKKIATPITVPSMELGGLKLTSLWRQGPFVMDCELALALATYGSQLTAIGVRELQFSRIWGYTPVRVDGVTKPYLSRHALGLAIDVYAFIDENGNKAVVETAYPQNDPFLLSIEDTVNASGGFRLCLTPKNDPVSHHDHFHLEANVIYPAPPPTRVSARETPPRRR